MHSRDPLPLALEMMASLGGAGIRRKRRFNLSVLLSRGFPHVDGERAEAKPLDDVSSGSAHSPSGVP